MIVKLSDLNITWRGVPASNYSAGRYAKGKEQKPLAIVNHIMDGFRWGTDSVFKNPVNQVSTHFAVQWNGDIWQYVLVQDTAYGNGVIEQMDISVPALKYCNDNGINPNTVTISIEHEGRPNQLFPEAQVNASLKLNAYLKATYGIKDENIIGHNRIQKINRANCPSKSFFWLRLFAFVNAAIDILKELKIVVNFQDSVTGKWVVEPFASAYTALGGSRFTALEVAGRPLTGMSKDADGKLVQDFERLRFESPDGNKVQFALSNKELRKL